MDEEQARRFAEDHLAAALPQRWRHVQAVAAEAKRLCGQLGIAPGSAVCAAWLHDIGYAPGAVATGFHPLDGARFLREHGWDTDVCALVANHSDALHQAAAQCLGDELRAEFADRPSLARDVLWTADILTGPDGERFTLDERLTDIATRYGSRHPVTVQTYQSRTALEAVVDRTARRLAALPDSV